MIIKPSRAVRTTEKSKGGYLSNLTAIGSLIPNTMNLPLAGIIVIVGVLVLYAAYKKRGTMSLESILIKIFAGTITVLGGLACILYSVSGNTIIQLDQGEVELMLAGVGLLLIFSGAKQIYELFSSDTKKKGKRNKRKAGEINGSS